MKKWMCLISALCLLMTCAAAEEYVTIGELREQAKAGWNETYTAKGREVVANVEMDWFPEEAEVCPVVEMESVTFEEEDSILDRYKEMRYGKVYVHENGVHIENRNVNAHRIQGNTNWRGKSIEDHFEYYDGEAPKEVPEFCDISYDEFIGKCNDKLGYLTGLTLEDFHIDRVYVNNPVYKAKMQDGELVRGDKITATGGYHLFAQQLVQGIPVLGTRESAGKGYLAFHYYQPEYNYESIFCVRKTKMIEEDVPLLSFDAFKSRLEKLIEAGKLRGIDRLRFGYGTCKKGNVWMLVPIWLVEGGYTEDTKKENVMPYIGKDGSLQVPEEYRKYIFSAQTGDLLEVKRVSGTRTEETLAMPKILTWDDVK